MAKTIAHPMSPDMAPQGTHWTVRAFTPEKAETVKSSAKSKQLSCEDMQIVAALNEAASDMAYIHSCMDHITEELLIDCLIYELKAASLRHKFFLDLCKDKGIVGGVPAC